MGVVCVIGAGLLTGASLADDPKSSKSSPPAAQAGQAVDLRPRYAEGQEMAFVQHTLRDDTMSAIGQVQTTKLDSTALWKVKVAKATEAGTEVVLMLETIKAATEQSVPGSEARKASWDSAKPLEPADRENPVLQAFRPLLGMPITITLAADGHITAVSGNDSVQPTQGVLQQFAYQMVSTEGVKSRWGPILVAKRGDGMAAPGASWKDELLGSAGPLGRSRLTTTSTLKSVADGFATITLDGTFEFLPAKDGETATAKTEGVTIDGQCLWDLKAGSCKSMEVRQKFTVNAGAQGIEVKKGVDSKVTTTRQ